MRLKGFAFLDENECGCLVGKEGVVSIDLKKFAGEIGKGLQQEGCFCLSFSVTGVEHQRDHSIDCENR